METLRQEEKQPENDLGRKEEQPPEARWKEILRVALDFAETLFLAAVLYLVIEAVSARVRVDGFSMRPTLDDGEFVLVSKLSYRFGAAERGDVVVFHYPLNPKQELIKRVIGLPGDHVAIKEGGVWVNGQKLNEPYIAAPPLYSGEWFVPENNLFVLGDNRNDSSDSHSWGYLPFENVVGKAVLIYWPPSVWGAIRHEQLLTQRR